MWRITNLRTKVEEYNSVHPYRGLQICTPLQSNTNDYKFVYLHRGLQICTPSQRITNLYTFAKDYKFVCLDVYTHHWQVYTGSLPRSTTATIIEDISDLKAGHTVAVYCDNYSREPVIGNCTFLTRISKYHGWRALIQAGNLGKSEALKITTKQYNGLIMCQKIQLFFLTLHLLPLTTFERQQYNT